jgi:hypothetical protein
MFFQLTVFCPPHGGSHLENGASAERIRKSLDETRRHLCSKTEFDWIGNQVETSPAQPSFSCPFLSKSKFRPSATLDYLLY